MTVNSIVVSAVNLIDGGTFSILIDCLREIASSDIIKDYRIVALVNNAKIMPKLDGVEYVEFPKSKRHYLYRLYYEYYYFGKLSKRLHPKLWLSLHDMSPRVSADIQSVYMHNPTPFYRPGWRGWKFVPINAIWAYLYKYVYRINIHSNKYLVVQQNWLRDEFSKMFSFPKNRIIVARPITFNKSSPIDVQAERKQAVKVFFYPAYPRVFKNFDVICEAAAIIEKEGISNLKIILTLDGTENKYSKYLVRKYSRLKIIDFCGLLPKEEMGTMYSITDCLLFPSKLETWGLPLSEFMPYNKPMIVADLPYAHESVVGAQKVSFFDPNNAKELAGEILAVVQNDLSMFQVIPQMEVKEPVTNSWRELFNVLLNP